MGLENRRTCRRELIWINSSSPGLASVAHRMEKNTASFLLACAALLLAPLALAQSAEALLEAKGCLGCHGVDEKKMGPALKEAAAKYKGAEAKLIASLRAGKGHPMKVEASDAELKAIISFLQGTPKPAPKPQAKPKAAAAPAAAPAMPLDNQTCLACHGNAG